MLKTMTLSADEVFQKRQVLFFVWKCETDSLEEPWKDDRMQRPAGTAQSTKIT